MSKKKKEIIDIDAVEFAEILKRVKPLLDEEDYLKLKAAVDTLGTITHEVESKRASVKRLRALLFGSQSEKLADVFPEKTEPESADKKSSPKEKKKIKGHGRNGVDKYVGAEKIKVSLDSLTPGDTCPQKNCTGKVYNTSEPQRLLRIKGGAPVQAKVYERERVRCNLCSKVFTAKLPKDAGARKYDEGAVAMIALLKYGTGLPFNRLDKLQGNLGIPLPRSTQWDLIEREALAFGAAYEALIQAAAQGQILYNDDTIAKILEFMGKRKGKDPPEKGVKVRTGVFTSGIISECGDQKIALFFTGRKHAGENLQRVLAERKAELGPPIQMCDSLSRNVPAGFKTILANCNSHGRRKFVDIAGTYPEECRYVLDVFAEIYRIDALAREQRMSPEERLAFHREHSRRPMIELRLWIRKRLRKQSAESHSRLGETFSYIKNHWRKFTLFFRYPGAPIDNNIVERALKKSIINRRNSLFFRSLNGARVADLYMSLIYTAELAGKNPLDYLTAIMKHSDKVVEVPKKWLPWNYRETLSQIATKS